jgi:hypothetical protein
MGFNSQPGPRIGIGTVLAQALHVIEEYLPSEIATVNAYYPEAPSIVMPESASIYTYMTYPKYVTSYPAIMLVPAQTRGIRHGIAAPHQDEYNLARSWIVDVLEQGSDWGDITARLMLWEIAIFELIGDTDSLDCGHTEFQESDWTQPRMTSRSSGDLLQDLPMLFTTQTYEYTRPTPLESSGPVLVNVKATT